MTRPRDVPGPLDRSEPDRAQSSLPIQREAIPGEDVIQRWSVPDFNGDHQINYWNQLPPSSFQNNGMVTSGIYKVPSENQAVLSAYFPGSNPVNTPMTMDVYQARGAFYERSHVIANALGGPGAVYNIIPLKKTTNEWMRDEIETPIRTARSKQAKRYFEYKVSVQYGGHNNDNLTTPEKAMASQLRFELTEKHYKGSGNTKLAQNWIDSNQGNLIPGNRRVLNHDLSGLDAAANNEMTQKGVVQGAYDHYKNALIDDLRNRGATDEIITFNRKKIVADISQVLKSGDFATAYTTQARNVFLEKLENSRETNVGQLRQRLTTYQNQAQTIVTRAEAAEAETGSGNLSEQRCRDLSDRLDTIFNFSSVVGGPDEAEHWIVPCETVAEIIYYFDHRHEQNPQIPISEDKAQKTLRTLLTMLIKLNARFG